MKTNQDSMQDSTEKETQSQLMNQFAKSTKASAIRTNNCIIYTRVSTKEQEQGYSLDAQLKECDEFARKNSLNVMGYFGGTYESAQTDERKEFNKMLQFVKRSKEKITYIIVYMVDRFSRSGANSIHIKEQLKDLGIYIQSVRQPVDASTSSGDFQQNIQMIFSHYDNQVRKEKCMSGTREALEKGEWVTKPPIGYDMIYANGKRTILLNEKGRLIQKAFHWKAQGYSTVEIIEKLKPLGLKLYNQMLGRIFRNPFYCGLLSHSALEGKLVKGNQELCVSEETFLKANEVLLKNPHGFHHVKENEPVPLKNFLKCDHCGNNMPGYIVRKKGIWYYKCRIKGCCNNKSAKQLHEQFQAYLDLLTVKQQYHSELKEIIVNKIKQLHSEQGEATKGYLNQVKEIQNRLNKIEERFVFEEISKELYDKYAGKLKLELNDIDQKLQLLHNKVSNPEGFAERLLTYSQNLREVWVNSDFKDKQKLQNMLFPQGIRYDKKTDECRTTDVQPVFGWVAHKQGETGAKEKGNSPLFLENSLLVAREGIEPSTSGL